MLLLTNSTTNKVEKTQAYLINITNIPKTTEKLINVKHRVNFTSEIGVYQTERKKKRWNGERSRDL